MFYIVGSVCTLDFSPCVCQELKYANKLKNIDLCSHKSSVALLSFLLLCRSKISKKEKAHQLACLHLVLCTNILYVFSAILLRCILPPFSPLSQCPLSPWNSYILMGHWWTSEKQITQRETERWRCGPGLAQPSVDYDVDSNPEGWTERLRVKGLCGLWAMARWMRYRQPWSLYFEC